MAGETLDQVLPRLRALVAAGAEIEQRSIDGEVLFVGAVATDVANIVQADAEVFEVMMRPLREPDGYTEDGAAVFDDNLNQPSPLNVARLDLIGPNVGFAHPTGTYSVVRPASPEMLERVRQWDYAVANNLLE